VLGKILGRRFAELLAWTRGKFLPPPKNLPPLQKTGKEQNISMKQILMEKYIVYGKIQLLVTLELYSILSYQIMDTYVKCKFK